MTLREFANALTPVGWACTATAAIGVLAVAAWLLTAPMRQASAAAQAKASAAFTSARADSAQAAVQVVDAGAARDAGVDVITRENRDAILKAPGADLRLDPALNAAGLRALCMRDAYRGSAECLQRADPVQP